MPLTTCTSQSMLCRAIRSALRPQRAPSSPPNSEREERICIQVMLSSKIESGLRWLH